MATYIYKLKVLKFGQNDFRFFCEEKSENLTITQTSHFAKTEYYNVEIDADSNREGYNNLKDLLTMSLPENSFTLTAN